MHERRSDYSGVGKAGAFGIVVDVIDRPQIGPESRGRLNACLKLYWITPSF